MTNFSDTICAPATSVGTGAISIIRISGPETMAAVDRVVRFSAGTAADADSYTLKRGRAGELDDVLVAFFRAPRSYTGEDCAEIYCHASAYIAGALLERLAEAGCRLAEPGEFTQRAFVNGKMDLAQAEAVADVIAAGSAAQHRVAMNQLRGGYSAELRELRARLLELTALLELELDFSEEEVEFADRERLRDLLDGARAHCRRLADSFRAGNAIKNGVPVAIVGAPNSGKSTLLNALLQDDRAIVSDIPGTTRDTVEECCVLDGILFRFIDTAGIRDTADAVERLGIERSLRTIAEAEIVLGVVDAAGAAGVSDAAGAARAAGVADAAYVARAGAAEEASAARGAEDLSWLGSDADSPIAGRIAKTGFHAPLSGMVPDTVSSAEGRIADALSGTISNEDPSAEGRIADALSGTVPNMDLSAEGRIAEAVRALAGKVDPNGQQLVILLNKCDILSDNKNVIDMNKIVSLAGLQSSNVSILEIAAKTGLGLDGLRSALVSRVGAEAAGGTLVTNARHAQALRDAAASLLAVSDGLDRRLPGDLLAEDLRAALASLGTITGEITTDEVLGEIFGRFCIGK